MKSFPAWLARLLVALLPLAATFLFAVLMMEGHLNFGGGDKDIFLLLPLLLFSLVFLFSCLFSWWRGVAPGRAARVSAFVSLSAVILLWLALVVVVLLQGGR